MGQHKGTALASRDWNMFLKDGLEDLLLGWEPDDAKKGASSQDRQNAKEKLIELYAAWDGSIPDAATQEQFANHFDSKLRAYAKQHGGTNGH